MIGPHVYPDELPTEMTGVVLRRVISDQQQYQYLHTIGSLIDDEMKSGQEIAAHLNDTERLMREERLGRALRYPLRMNIEWDGRTTGNAILTPVEGQAFIGVCVRQEYRRHGLANMAARTLMRLAVQYGYERVVADTRPDNEASIGLLVKQGFRAEELWMTPEVASPGLDGRWLRWIWNPLLQTD